MRRQRTVHTIIDVSVAYNGGRDSRKIGLPYKAPERYDIQLRHWWFAGYNDLDIELRHDELAKAKREWL